MSHERIKVRLLFSDSGAFHHEDLEIPASAMEGYDRLIDGLQENPDFLKGAYLDVGRLCAAWLVNGED